MTRRAARPRPLLALVQALAQGYAAVSWDLWTDAQLHWAVETGFGPLLFQLLHAQPDAVASPHWPMLHGAHITAQFLSGEQHDALEELLDAGAGWLPPVTLLKGISISGQYYPAPHLRPMRDLDILVDEAAGPAVEALLRTLGYCQRSRSQLPAVFFASYHHSMPFFHAQRGVWIEVHRDLFPPTSPLSRAQVFSRAHVATQRRPAAFRGHAVWRLSDELQLVYIAAHWAQSCQRLGGMIAMVDTIYLLQQTTATLDWGRMTAWLDGSVAAPPVCLLLTYLARHQVIAIDPQVLQRLWGRQGVFGTLNVRLLHALVDRYLIGGRPVGPLLRPRQLQLFWESLLAPDAALSNLLRACLRVLVPVQWHPGFARLYHRMRGVVGRWWVVLHR